MRWAVAAVREVGAPHPMAVNEAIFALVRRKREPDLAAPGIPEHAQPAGPATSELTARPADAGQPWDSTAFQLASS